MAGFATNEVLAVAATLAAALYLYTAVQQLLRLERREENLPRAILIPAVVALLLHGFVIFDSSATVGGNFGFYRVASLTFWLMGVLSLIILAVRPLQTLLMAIFPLAAIAILVATLTPETARPMTDTPRGLLLHISTSIIGYALLGLATLQGLLVLQQSRLLRQHKTRGLIRLLPPLDRTEQVMHELIAMGKHWSWRCLSSRASITSTIYLHNTSSIKRYSPLLRGFCSQWSPYGTSATAGESIRR